MSLGSGFPPDFLRQRVQAQLRPGAVIKLVRKMDDGLLHEKRFVVLHVDETTVTCVINSRISRHLSHGRCCSRSCQSAGMVARPRQSSPGGGNSRGPEVLPHAVAGGSRATAALPWTREVCLIVACVANEQMREVEP